MPGIVFDRRGGGEPLVLVHGVGSRWQVWEPVLDRLAASHEVVSLDLPGFGASPPDGTVPSVEGQAERVERFFSELGLERPHVVGNSMGGAIALELARRGSVASVTAVSPAGFWTPRERAYSTRTLLAMRAVAAAAPPRLRDALAANRVTRTPTYALLLGRPWRLPARDAVESLEALLSSASFGPALDAFQHHVFREPDELRGTPVTIAWGDRDRLLLYGRQSRRARRLLPWARHVTLRGCGHLPFSDDPEQVAAVLLAGARAPAAAAR
jgi:pimeloyl-ACP methyl ester carboxylesterase